MHIFIIYKFVFGKRQKKAYELDDDYDYTTNNLKAEIND